MMTTTILKTGLAALALTIACTGASHAKTVTLPACATASVTVSTACQTVAGNNDSLSGMNAGTGVFGTTDWLLADKSDAGAPSLPAINLSFGGAGGTTGSWSVGSYAGYTKAILVEKGGSVAWVAYLLDLTQTSGSWSTFGILNEGGKQPRMSHLSLYVADYVAPRVVPLPVVPLSAGLPLLLAGLGALAALRRKRA